MNLVHAVTAGLICIGVAWVVMAAVFLKADYAARFAPDKLPSSHRLAPATTVAGRGPHGGVHPVVRAARATAALLTPQIDPTAG